MKIHIEEVWFDEDSLTEGFFSSEEDRKQHIERYGEVYTKYCAFTGKENPELELWCPLFLLDSEGEAISPRKQKDSIGVAPSSAMILRYVSDALVCLFAEEGLDKEAWIYVCRRKDAMNYIGIITLDQPACPKKVVV